MSFDVNKYTYQFTKEKYDRVSILFPKGTKKEIQDKTGESINAFVNRVVREALNKLLPENGEEPDAPSGPSDATENQ